MAVRAYLPPSADDQRIDIMGHSMGGAGGQDRGITTRHGSASMRPRAGTAEIDCCDGSHSPDECAASVS